MFWVFGFFVLGFLFFVFCLILLLMSFEMEGQVIGARETALAVNTFERFGAGVFPIVARQLVTAGESPLATLP